MKISVFISFSLFFVGLGVLPACRVFTRASEENVSFSRKEAIEIYAGGIPEQEFLSRINATSKLIPSMPNTYAIELQDGELFYKIELQDNVRYVSEILLPESEEIPQELRSYAKSFFKNKTKILQKFDSEKSLQFYLSEENEILFCNESVSERLLLLEFERIGKLPEEQQTPITIFTSCNANVSLLSRLINSAENAGVKHISIRIKS